MAQQPLIIQQQKSEFTPGKAIAVLIVATGVFFGGRYVWRTIQGSLASKNLDKPEYQIAEQIWNSKGIVKDDEDNAVSLAKQIKESGLDLKDVASAFQKLHPGRTLDEYLTSFMSTENLKRFYDTLKLTAGVDPKTGEPTKIQSKNDWSPNQYVIAKSNVNIRKTPKLYKPTITQAVKDVFSFQTTPQTNIIGLASPGTIVGITSGRTSLDESASPVVLFVEVRGFMKKANGQVVSSPLVWVAASQVEPKSVAQVQQAGNKPTAFSEAAYNFAKSINGTAEQPDFSREIVAAKQLHILDNKMKPVQSVPAGIILGHPVAELNTGKRIFLKIHTLNGFMWWVDKADTREVKLK